MSGSSTTGTDKVSCKITQKITAYVTTFNDLKSRLQQCGRKYRIVAVCVDDGATRNALPKAEETGVAEIHDVNAPTQEEAAAHAVSMIRHGEADVLMKGMIGTDQLLHAVLRGTLPAKDDQ